MLLALLLIIIFTAMAFIKNAYASKQKPWQEIIGDSFKGLAGFIFIPVCCLLGVWVGNILLNAIDGATSYGGAMSLERKLFIACAYNANDMRANPDYNGAREITNIITSERGEHRAYVKVKSLLEDAKDANGRPFNTIITLEYRGKDSETLSNEDLEYYAEIVDRVYSEADNIKLWWYGDVERCYQLWNINYLMLLVVGIFMIGVMLSLAYGMIKRLILLMMMFVISPALCALYPIDGGSAVGSYKKEFIKHTISAYAAVVGMNLFMSILPLLQQISLTGLSGSTTAGDVDMYVQLILITSGLYVVKEFVSTIAGWIGGGNALADGENLKKNVTDSIKKKTKEVTGGFARYSGAINKKGFFKGLGSQVFADIKKESGFDDIQKSWKEGYEGSQKGLQETADKRKAEDAFKRNKSDVDSLLTSNKGMVIDDDDIAATLAKFDDKGAREIAAQKIAEHNSRNGKMVTKEKVLEAPDKVKTAKANRANARDSRIEYDTALADLGKTESDITAFKSNPGLSALGISFNTTTGEIESASGFASQAELAQLEADSKDSSKTDAARSDAAKKLAEAKARIKEKEDYEALLQEQENQVRDLKRSAIAFANNIITAAEDFSPDEKRKVKAIGEDLKNAVNKTNVTKSEIETAYTTAEGKLQSFAEVGLVVSRKMTTEVFR